MLALGRAITANLTAYVGSVQGALKPLLEDVGFCDVNVVDLTENVKPRLRLFYVIAYIPYHIIRIFRLEPSFVNTVAAVVGYRYIHLHRYVAVSARKPGVDGHLGVEVKKTM